MPLDPSIHWKPVRDPHYVLASIQSSARGYYLIFADQEVLSIPSDGTAAHLHHVLDVLRDNGLQPERVSSHRPTLDDVFLALTA